MSLASVLIKIGEGIVHPFEQVVDFFKKAQDIFKLLQKDYPLVASLFKTLIQDVMQAATDGDVAIAEKGTNITIDVKVWEDVQNLVEDAKAGIPTARKILEDLGVKI